MSFWTELKYYVTEKLNPAQSVIVNQEGTSVSTSTKISYFNAFGKLESVNRGVGMIVGACSSLDYDIKDKLFDGGFSGVRQKTLFTLLNVRPNPYQTIQDFRSSLFTDFLLEGNAFIYYDGAYLYHLPASHMQINPDETTYIKSFTYGNTKEFSPREVVYFKDTSVTSIYRGTSRLQAADRNIRILYKMQEFQENFFVNGAVPGFALATENTLSQVAKDRSIANWMAKYNPNNGGRRPIIIDSGLKPVQLFNSTFKEMDFDTNVSSNNVRILETLGVPPVLLDGGNQANISPNLRLFYLETVMPIIRKYVSAMEFLTGYDIEAVTSNVSAMQPDLKDIGAYHVGLVNGGIETPNEARDILRLPKDKDAESDKLRIPANISGSASQPNTGGAPTKPKPNN